MKRPSVTNEASDRTNLFDLINSGCRRRCARKW